LTIVRSLRMGVLVCGVLIGDWIASKSSTLSIDAAAQANAAQTNAAPQTKVLKPIAFGESKPARDMSAPQIPGNPDDVRNGSAIRTIKNQALPRDQFVEERFDGMDMAIQSIMPQLAIPPPSTSFDGLSNQDNFNAFGFRLSPPDPDGDVGPNHYVQQVNLLVRVYDKTGAPLTPPFKLSSLWASAGLTDACATTDDGDPIVLYDALADRWLLSQFALPSFPNPPYFECIAISKSGDPTGQYFVYTFNTPGNEMPDYPKLGVWPEAYYMTTNQFTNAGPFNGAGFFAFERAKMLAGDPSAALLYTSMTEGCPACLIGGVLPSDLDGLTPPPAGAPNVFAMFLATEFADPLDGLRLWNVSANFDTTTLTITDRAESPVAVAAFDPRSPAGRADIEQPPPALSTHALDAISDRLLYRLAYRNFGTHQSLVVNHTVNVGTGVTQATHQAGVRYYELRSTGGAFSVNEQATFAPDTDNRWMVSAAQDNQGNLAVGYTVSSLTTFPSIRYAGRLATDPANGLFQGEASLVAGTGVQRSTGSRWGDYSRMAIDPVDDCTFWYTNEYYTAASQASSTVGWLTHIGKFKFAECTAVPKGTLAITVTNCATGDPIAGAQVFIGATLYGVTNAAGSFTASLAPGTYTVTVQSGGFGTVTTTATVTNGGTTTLAICLTGVPVIGSIEAELTGESCAPANSAADPGERVTYALTLANSGFGATTNLTGTLLTGPGITSPSAPQNFGVLPPGGSATRPFSFTTNGACGTFVTATVQLTDGMVNHGTRTFTFALGATEPGPGASENFDTVTPPALPAAWTAARTGGTAAIDWVTTTAFFVSAPNGVATGSVPVVASTTLTSPVLSIGDAGGTVEFRNNFALETGFDGGVLEISINGAPFADIVAAGGAFIVGGYNATIDTDFGNPIAGRPAWSGNSGGFILTRAMLPAAAAGQSVQLRWLAGYDNSVSPTGAGWRIDDLVIASRQFVCSQTCADVRITTSASLVRLNATTVRATITVSNTGTTSAQNAQLTQARLGAVNGVPLPQPLGTIPGGGATNAVVTFTGVPPGASSLSVTGTYDGGTFSGARRVVVP
jgi:hypothetical protein